MSGKIFILFLALSLGAGAAAPGIARPAAAPDSSPRITILYDNTVADASCTADWGFAALVAGLDKTILFDTGTKEDIFLGNVDRLKADLGAVDIVVLSHDHGDHTGGLVAALPRMKNPLILLPVPLAAVTSFKGLPSNARVECRTEASTLCPGASLTGILGAAIREQALILDTPRGIVVLTGCAHPGIVGIVERAKSLSGKPVEAVLGGFHLLSLKEKEVEIIIGRFRDLGVKKVGATHCTGETAIALFRKAYGRDFVEMGVGRTLRLDDLRP